MIAVDIDDTLYKFEEIARDAFFMLAQERDEPELVSGAYLSWDEWRVPNDHSEELWQEAIKLAHQPEQISAQIPMRGAAETLQGLVDGGHNLLYISNRDPSTKDATEGWLEEHGFPMSYKTGLICTTEDKQQHIAGCQYIIDDRPKTLVQFVFDHTWEKLYGEDNPRTAFGIWQPHNRNLTDVPGIYLAPSWRGLNFFFVKKGLLQEMAYA